MSLVSRFGPEGVTDRSPTEQAEHDRWLVECPPHQMGPGTLAEESPAEVAATPAGERSPSATAWSGALPTNAVTGAAYRGKNIDRLLLAEAAGGYGPGGWAGFKQWLSVGRVVRKGEHGTACITVIGKMRDEGEDTTASAGKQGIRGFRVFHYDQTTELGEVDQ